MKYITTAVALLFWLSSWAGAEEITVKVSNDRAAVMQIHGTGGDPDLAGTIKGAANLKEGKSGLRADLLLKKAAELTGASADLYARLTGQTIEAIGYLNMKVPADPTAPKVFDLSAESVTEGDQSAANFKLALEAPQGPEAAPKGSGKFAMKGDFKAFKSTGEFELSGGPISGGQVPFRKFELSIVETVASESAGGESGETGSAAPVKTAISFTFVTPKGSEFAGQLAALPAMAPMLEQQLKSAQVKVEGVSFAPPTEEGDNSISKGSLTLVDLRGTIKSFLPLMAAQMQGPPEVQKGMEEMIETRFDTFSVALEFQDTSVKGTFAVDCSQLDKFFSGYLAILPAVQEVSNQQMLEDAGELGPLLAPFLRLNTEQAVESVKLLSTSSMTVDAEVNFSLDVKGAEGQAEKTVAFLADGKLSSTNYQDYVTKAKAAGLPVAEKAVGKLTLNLKDQTALTGDLYVFTDGDLVNYYKGMLAKAAQEGQAPEDVQKTISELSFEEVSFKMSLLDNKMTLLGRSTTSDLSKALGLILKQANPALETDLTGVAIDASLDEQGSGKSQTQVFFANFLPGRDAAGIKEVLGLPANAQVTLDAPANELAMVAVEQPELVVDGKLAEVQAQGQKLLASSPNEVAQGGSSGGGAGNWGLIVVGVLLLAGVGGFLAFGKKS